MRRDAAPLSPARGIMIVEAVHRPLERTGCTWALPRT